VVSLLLMALPAASSADELMRLPVDSWTMAVLKARLFTVSACCAAKALMLELTMVMGGLLTWPWWIGFLQNGRPLGVH
jgi:hypothetical protein